MFTLDNLNYDYVPVNPDDLYFFYDWRFKITIGNRQSQIIKGCFSTFYADGIFLEAIVNVLLQYEEAGVEGCWWYYPDLESAYPEDVFEGVCFELGFADPANRIYVTEQENFEYTKLACQRFVEIHPEHKRLITIILDNWMPLNSI